MEGQSQSYHGNAAEVIFNPCVDWTLYEAGSSALNNTFVIDANFPETTVADASNYCRAPDGDTRPWCYIDDDFKWGYCNVPVCRGKVNIKIARILFDD